MDTEAGYTPRTPIFPAKENHAVCVAAGYGVVVNVRDGALSVIDGIGTERRERTYVRAGRSMRRLVILGTGTVTTAALSWCADVGATVIILDRRGRTVLSSARGTDDARLRRAQAAAYGTPLGAALACELVRECVRARADIAAVELGNENLARLLAAVDLPATDLGKLRESEAAAAAQYFAGWRTVRINFARRERIPEHWTTFPGRRSALAPGSPRNAAGPVNALLNYLYTLGEVECRNALIRVGLDAGLGIFHADARDRDSLALDLLEVVRPQLERYALRILSERVFAKKDFTETPDGRCRLGNVLAQSMTASMPEWAEIVAPWAERIAHALADASPYDIPKRTVLTNGRTVRPRRVPLWWMPAAKNAGR